MSWLRTGGSAWVRINDHSTEFWHEDVDHLIGPPGLSGVVLAKTESPAHETETFDRVGGSTRVLPLIESALGVEEATFIAKSRGAFRLAFGSGDYRRDTGTSADNLAMAYPRSRLVVASRIGHLPGPIDGPAIGSNRVVLQEQSSVAVALGLTGKLCRDREQIHVINEAISPTKSDVIWARNFLETFRASGGKIMDGAIFPDLVGQRKSINWHALSMFSGVSSTLPHESRKKNYIFVDRNNL